MQQKECVVMAERDGIVGFELMNIFIYLLQTASVDAVCEGIFVLDGQMVGVEVTLFWEVSHKLYYNHYNSAIWLVATIGIYQPFLILIYKIYITMYQS